MQTSILAQLLLPSFSAQFSQYFIIGLKMLHDPLPWRAGATWYRPQVWVSLFWARFFYISRAEMPFTICPGSLAQ